MSRSHIWIFFNHGIWQLVSDKLMFFFQFSIWHKHICANLLNCLLIIEPSLPFLSPSRPYCEFTRVGGNPQVKCFVSLSILFIHPHMIAFHFLFQVRWSFLTLLICMWHAGKETKSLIDRTLFLSFLLFVDLGTYIYYRLLSYMT